MKQMLRLSVAIIALSAVLTTGCSVNPVTGATEFSLVSAEQEVAIGTNNYGPSQQSQGGRYYIDPNLQVYIRDIGKKLAAVSDRPNLPYEFVVLNNSTANAWALPGGKIAVNRGLLLHLDDEAELAAAAKKGGFKGMLSYLLDKGFVLTRIFDSLAIATGGATFYMNRQKSLLNRINEKTGKKYTKAEAEQQAFDDFYAIAEETQQSSNPSKISSQQASFFGRLILSFQNVTMQYNRKAKKMLLDLVNRRRRPGMTQRESDLSNLSGVIYYVGMQNLIFNSLQQALFAVAFEDEEEKDRNKTADTINGMVDSILFGLGFGGAIISTVKNVIRELDYQAGKKTPEYEEAIFNLFDISPVIDTKVRNIRNGLRTFSWNMADIKRRGWSLDNPAYIAISSIISGATNIPIDRLFRKINNIRQATDENVRTFERIALLLGWNGWNFGLPYWGRESTIKKEEAELERLKKRFEAQVKYAKSNGFTKRVPFTGAKSWSNGIPKGLKEGVDYIAIERYDGIIQYYKKP